MISKRKLKERLLDICNGAGYEWNSEYGYFEVHSVTQLSCVGGVIQAVERLFDIEADYLRLPWNLEKFDDIDAMTDYIYAGLAT